MGRRKTLFTKEMKKTFTLLMPDMLPVHFAFMANIFRLYGYKAEILKNAGRSVVDAGLRNVHNDTCYPALLVIGQMIDAIESGNYDIGKIAFLITQTGGGCRASNYIHLLRKALKKRGYGHIPVLSLNVAGLEDNYAMRLPPSAISKLVYAVLLGDLLMLLSNQTRPYELDEGSADRAVDHWVHTVVKKFSGRRFVRYGDVKSLYCDIIRYFEAIPKNTRKKIRVGVVGEIYVKYSPLGNNNLEAFLLSEGAEVVVPGLTGFLLYCIYNKIVDKELYGGNMFVYFAAAAVYRAFLSKQMDMIRAVRKSSAFDAPTPFEQTKEAAKGYINLGAKMGEGWLLTAEMLELIHDGVENIVCTQPFGCLPNHIVGKGMLRIIKENNPGSNIIAVDYDPGASEINQQNRIKLMLANASSPQKK